MVQLPYHNISAVHNMPEERKLHKSYAHLFNVEKSTFGKYLLLLSSKTICFPKLLHTVMKIMPLSNKQNKFCPTETQFIFLNIEMNAF